MFSFKYIIMTQTNTETQTGIVYKTVEVEGQTIFYR